MRCEVSAWLHCSTYAPSHPVPVLESVFLLSEILKWIRDEFSRNAEIKIDINQIDIMLRVWYNHYHERGKTFTCQLTRNNKNIYQLFDVLLALA